MLEAMFMPSIIEYRTSRFVRRFIALLSFAVCRAEMTPLLAWKKEGPGNSVELCPFSDTPFCSRPTPSPFLCFPLEQNKKSHSTCFTQVPLTISIRRLQGLDLSAASLEKGRGWQ